MYGKALIPGAEGLPAVPMLITTASPGVALPKQLHELGWVTYGNVAENVPGEVYIAVDRLQISANDAVLLDDPDGDPVSPPGWWEAVSAAGDRCLVVVVPRDAVQLGSPEVGSQMAALIDSNTTASAMVPVQH
jgi:hypothetical protein